MLVLLNIIMMFANLSEPFLAFNTNLLINGDGETGPCQTGGGVTSPPGWNYNGTITQVSYNNSMFGPINSTDPGPR